MEISHIQEFVKLAETGSFSKAAELSFTSQPNLSKRIKAMEKELGVQLFERTTKSVNVTEAGKVVLRYFTDIGALYDKALNDLDDYLHPHEGSLSVGCPLYCLTRYAEPALLRFKNRYPQFGSPTFVNVPRGKGVEALRDELCDVFIGTYDWVGEAAGITAFPFTEEQYYIAMLREDPLAHHMSITGDDMKNRIIIMPSKPSEGADEARRKLTHYLSDYGVSAGKIICPAQEDSYALTVKATGGLAVVPDCMRQHRNYIMFLPLADGKIRTGLSSVAMCCFYREAAAQQNPAIKLFCDSIRSLFK